MGIIVRGISIINGSGFSALTMRSTAPFTGTATGIAYSFFVIVTGGNPAYVFSISAGALPTGLTINAATGEISGTPTAVGTFNFTVSVTDANGAVVSLATSIAVSNGFDLFSDSFGPDSIATIRNRYSFLQQGAAACANAPSVGAINSGLYFTGAGGVNATVATWIPRQLGAVLNQNQFSQATILSDIGAGLARAGWTLLCSGDQRAVGAINNSYTLTSIRSAGILRIERNINSVKTVLASVAIPAVGARITFTAAITAATFLEVFSNGVSILTFNDNVLPISQGLPGIFTQDSAVGADFEFGSFRAGKLSLV